MLVSRGLDIWSTVFGPGRKWFLVVIIFQPVLPPFSIYDLYPSNSDMCPHHYSFFSYISAFFSSFAFLLMSPCSYKPPHTGFRPCSSLFCLQAGLHSSPAGHLAAWREDTRVTGWASILVYSALSFTTSVVLYPVLPHSLAARKLQGSPLSSGIWVGVRAFVSEDGVCLVLLTPKSSVKDSGSSEGTFGRISAERRAATNGFGSWNQWDLVTNAQQVTAGEC